MSMLDIRVPAEQEGTRSQVLRWIKQPGEAVRQHEPLVELETDKVTVEVAAPADGVLREILKDEGEELQPGEVLGRLEAGVDATGVPADAAKAGAKTEVELTTFVATPVDASTAAAASAVEDIATRPLSPAVKRLMAERSLESSQLRGTGEGGRITVTDVLAYRPEASAPSARRVPHSPMRQRVAEHMVESLLHTAPHVTSVFEADLGNVIEHRERHRADFERRGVPLTFTAYFIRASIAAIRAVPEANSYWTDEALELHEHMNIGVATALEGGGLIVPVLSHVEALDLFGIASGLNDLVSRARNGALSPTDMRGGTFTISNHGVGGSLFAAPIVINQPQSAILGVGKLERRAVVLDDDRIVARLRCYVTLTIDHRVMDGDAANRFLRVFVGELGAGGG